jgi:hypothetical protein
MSSGISLIICDLISSSGFYDKYLLTLHMPPAGHWVIDLISKEAKDESGNVLDVPFSDYLGRIFLEECGKLKILKEDIISAKLDMEFDIRKTIHDGINFKCTVKTKEKTDSSEAKIFVLGF